jgi:molybdate transport system ATP-binding protein
MIELKEVTVSQPGKSLVSQFQIRFDSGVSYLIEGKNGAGKTTLLNLIAGKIQPTTGSVHYSFIDDRLEWEQKFELRKKYIHYIPTTGLHELISVPDLYYQQRYYTIESTPLPTVRDYFGERCKALAELKLPGTFQLSNLLDLELTRLSNGQVKKVVILKQLLDTIPKVILLDYPFEGLDAESRRELSEFLQHLTITYQIQLIIADQDHGQLPAIITKKVVIRDSDMTIVDRVNVFLTPTVPFHSNPANKDTEPVVELRNVKIQYGRKVVVENLNWSIKRGERWALTGRNGSGKTTLFSLIYADHPMAYSEEVFLFGKRRGTGESIWDIKNRISYLGPEQLHFLDYATEQLTVREYLGNVPPEDYRLIQIIEQFQIEVLLQSRLRQLSHGQLQLVLLLSLFLSQKELLLLDEPFQFLDPVQKSRVSEYLHSHIDEATTLILITHYEEDVARWTHYRLTI